MNDVLIPEKEQVIIADRKYSIGELSLKQFLQISKFLARTVLSSQKKLKELKERTAGSESNIDDIMTILDLLEEKDLYQFIGILLNENDTDFSAMESLLSGVITSIHILSTISRIFFAASWIFFDSSLNA
jgi:hypothetical protein